MEALAILVTLAAAPGSSFAQELQFDVLEINQLYSLSLQDDPLLPPIKVTPGSVFCNFRNYHPGGFIGSVIDDTTRHHRITPGYHVEAWFTPNDSSYTISRSGAQYIVDFYNHTLCIGYRIRCRALQYTFTFQDTEVLDREHYPTWARRDIKGLKH